MRVVVDREDFSFIFDVSIVDWDPLLLLERVIAVVAVAVLLDAAGSWNVRPGVIRSRLMDNRSHWQFFFYDLHQNVVLENTFFGALLWNEQDPLPMLDALPPFTLVVATISPIHLSIAIPKILLIVSLVDIA